MLIVSDACMYVCTVHTSSPQWFGNSQNNAKKTKYQKTMGQICGLQVGRTIFLKILPTVLSYGRLKL